MEGFSLAAVTTSAAAGSTSALSVNATTRLPSILLATRTRSVAFRRKHKFLVFASNQEPDFTEWEEMEIKFGRMMKEDPRLTLAKIKARRLDPNASVLELEKSFYRNKGKLPDIEVIPLDWEKPSGEVRLRRVVSKVDGLSLVRPVPKKGVKFESSIKPNVSDTRKKPNVLDTRKKPNLPNRKPAVDVKRSTVPDVILRKPASKEGVEEKSSELRFEPNLSLNISNAQAPERFSDMTLLRKPGSVIVGGNRDIESKKNDAMLLRKPKPTGVNEYHFKNQELSGGAMAKVVDDMKLKVTANENVDKSDMLLRKPEYVDNKQELSSGAKDLVMDDMELKTIKEESEVKQSDFTLLKKPESLERKSVQSGIPEVMVNDNVEQNAHMGTSESSQMGSATKDDFAKLVSALDGLLTRQAKKDSDSNIGVKQVEHIDVGSSKEEIGPREQSATGSVNSDSDRKFSVEAALQGKPKRIDQLGRGTPKSARASTDFAYPVESYGSEVGVELENISVGSPSKDLEDAYWTRAEELLETGKLEEVELIRAGSRGFVVSFGPLIGHLPYKNLTARWKFVPFESWLRSNGLDPSMYWESEGVIQSYGISKKNPSPEVDQKFEGGISPDMRLEDLLKIYEQEKNKFLSSLVGQTLNVCVKVADRKFRKIVFSLKTKKDDDLVERKKNLMAKLRIGDVVKCRITKIAYFGVFVEVEGVPALIHQTEVSWDATLDPASYFKIGQILEAKVFQLNFELERIFLSLRELTPDPLSSTLESVIGDDLPFDGKLQAAEADTEWADVESLIKELQQIEGVQSASKGQFFLSPGLAPTFQVYMASMFEDQYKLLAREGKKVQEVIVRASLDKEEMKAAILTCTNRVG